MHSGLRLGCLHPFDTLASLNIKNHAVFKMEFEPLEFWISVEVPRGTMEVPQGKVIRLKVKSTDKVGSVMLKIWEKDYDPRFPTQPHNMSTNTTAIINEGTPYQ